METTAGGEGTPGGRVDGGVSTGAGPTEESAGGRTAAAAGFSFSQVPWQIQVTLILYLAVDLYSYVTRPNWTVEPFGALTMVLMTVGLLLRWRPVFVLFLINCVLGSVLAVFQNPLSAAFPVLLAVLVISSRRYYFGEGRGRLTFGVVMVALALFAATSGMMGLLNYNEGQKNREKIGTEEPQPSGR